jgi:phosphoribosyl-AMP cyclohydrolase
VGFVLFSPEKQRTAAIVTVEKLDGKCQGYPHLALTTSVRAPNWDSRDRLSTQLKGAKSAGHLDAVSSDETVDAAGVGSLHTHQQACHGDLTTCQNQTA